MEKKNESRKIGKICLVMVVIAYVMMAGYGAREVQAANIPIGAICFKGSHTYYAYEQEMTWTEAKAFCEAQGGHLMTVGSEVEYDYLIETTGSPKYGLGCWIGYYRENAKSGWKSVDNTEIYYKLDWKDSFDYYTDNGLKYTAFLHYDDCAAFTNEEKHPFICEWDWNHRPAVAPKTQISSVEVYKPTIYPHVTIKITWKPVNGIAGYILYASNNKNGPYGECFFPDYQANIDEGSTEGWDSDDNEMYFYDLIHGTSVIATGFENKYKKTFFETGKTYYFKIRVVRAFYGYDPWGGYSKVVAKKIPRVIPKLSKKVEGGKLVLTWQRGEENKHSELFYYIGEEYGKGYQTIESYYRKLKNLKGSKGKVKIPLNKMSKGFTYNFYIVDQGIYGGKFYELRSPEVKYKQ